MSNQPTNDGSLEASVIELLGYFKQVIRFFLKTIFIPILLAIGLAFWANKKIKAKPNEYYASLSFIKTSELNTSNSALAAVPTFAVGQPKSENNLSLVVLSDMLLTKALFKPTTAPDGKLLINEFLDTYNEDFQNVEYFTVPVVDSFSLKHKRVYKSILGRLKNEDNPLLTVEYDEVYYIRALSTSPELTLSLVENVYSAASEFYDNAVQEKETESLDRLRTKRDSTLRMLQGYQGMLARAQTRSALDIQPTDVVDEAQILSRLEIAKGQYTQFESSLQQFQLKAAETEPTFQKLDTPIKPLGTQRKNVTRATIVGAVQGFVVGLFLCFFLFIFFKFLYFYKKA